MSINVDTRLLEVMCGFSEATKLESEVVYKFSGFDILGIFGKERHGHGGADGIYFLLTINP